ncbi:MAG: ECF transporter S component [Clostridia bacterium]|nr:ECF transporter S component [Clostridia bacterium]
MHENRSKLYKITAAGVFSAIVVVLQCTLGLITVGQVSLNFVLVPIVIAGILYGPVVGTVAGLAFGITVFIQCLTGAQGAFGLALIEINWFYCFILCAIRGFLIGFAPAIIWKWSSAIKNNYVRALIPSLVTPVVNTGLFLLGYAVLFNGHMHSIMPEGAGVIYFLFITLAGVNFVFEFVTSGLLIPPIASALIKSLEKKAE